MWNHDKQARFDSLRDCEHAGTLTASERDELQALYEELYALEAAAHTPQARHVEREIVALEVRNRQLAAFLKERERFLQRVKKTVKKLKTEEHRLREQYAGILTEVSLDASSIEVS